MENEVMNLVNVWFTVITCLCYCYVLGFVVPKGIKRLIFVVPVTCLFLYLPLKLSSAFFCGFTSFFVAWLTNFKLLLFAFGKGPLPSRPPLSLPLFLIVASIPIQVRDETLSPEPRNKPFKYALKAIVAAILIRSKYYLYVNQFILAFLNFVQMYVFLELGLVMLNGLAQFLIGSDLEPTFNKPYLATSLQDFWSRRWNRMVPHILKPAVYEPIRGLATHVVGRKWAPIPGILVTFMVSSAMHELLFYYLGHEKPTGELTLFFMIQGFGVATEVAWKKTFHRKWMLPPLISWCLTMGFITVMIFWFFIPTLHRCNAFERASLEYDAFIKFIANVTSIGRAKIL